MSLKVRFNAEGGETYCFSCAVRKVMEGESIRPEVIEPEEEYTEGDMRSSSCDKCGRFF